MRKLFLLFILPLRLAAQELPTDLQPGLPTSSSQLQTEIDNLLGGSESIFMKGVHDEGVDYASLAVEKALDEVIQGVAGASVYAAIAEKILTKYQESKDKKLAKKLSELREAWKQGQARLNKIAYQDFKIKYEFAKNMNAAPRSVAKSERLARSHQEIKGIYPSGVGAVLEVYDEGGPIQQLLNRTYGKRGDYLDYYGVGAAYGILGDTQPVKARQALTAQEGKTTFTSPFQRIQLQRRSHQEARDRNAALRSLQTQLHTAVKLQRQKEYRENLSKGLNKRFQPY